MTICEHFSFLTKLFIAAAWGSQDKMICTIHNFHVKNVRKLNIYHYSHRFWNDYHESLSIFCIFCIEILSILPTEIMYPYFWLLYIKKQILNFNEIIILTFHTVRSACFHKKRPYCGVIVAMFLCMLENREETAVTSSTFGNRRCNVSFPICQVSMFRSLSNLQPDVRDILLTSCWITLLDNNLLKELLELTDRILEHLPSNFQN